MSGISRLTALCDALPPLPRRLMIGLSGGADSVALTRMLLLLRDRGQAELSAVHVNHGLRGEDSDADEAFVRALCVQWALPLRCYRLTPPEHPGEGWAREARYRCFREAMAEEAMDALALAHHREDQAETLLMHLIRGAGLTGLSGMAAESVNDGLRLVRPLLNVSRLALRDALTECGQPWREDQSNGDPRFLRNAVRLEALPLLERLSPGATARIASAASLLRQEEDALEAEAEALVARRAAGNALPLSALTGLPEARACRALRRWWRERAGVRFAEHSLSRSQSDALFALLSAPASSRCNLPGQWQGFRGWTHLHLMPPDTPAPPEPVALTAEGAALRDIRLTVTPWDGMSGDGRQTQAAPLTALAGCVLRTRRPGDWIRPFGGAGRKSLKEYMIDKRVDAPFRDRVALVCRGSEVLLASGVGAGNLPLVDGARDMRTLRFSGEMPWMAEAEK